MDTLEKHNNEMEEKFNEKFNGYWRGLSIPDEIKFFITSQNTELLKKIAEGGDCEVRKRHSSPRRRWFCRKILHKSPPRPTHPLATSITRFRKVI
jgi:hypothetical protein